MTVTQLVRRIEAAVRENTAVVITPAELRIRGARSMRGGLWLRVNQTAWRPAAAGETLYILHGLAAREVWQLAPYAPRPKRRLADRG